MTRQDIARIALRSSIEARRKANASLADPICIYDFVEKLGVEARFVGGASFAGMSAKGFDVVFVPAERPAGRRAFTCAHELAHWWFGHGVRVEHLDFDREDCVIPEEMLANQFAAFLLMPNRAIKAVFERRGYRPQTATALEIYAIACQFGVGYGTLVKHLHWSQNLISRVQMQELQRISPKEIRHELLGLTAPGHLVFADHRWTNVAIDLEVGDHALLPQSVQLVGASARIVGSCARGAIVQAVRPGITQAIGDQDWAHMIRVSRKMFVGRGAFRHLEDEDEDNDSASHH